MAGKVNPIVFMDIAIRGFPAGRMIFELFADVVPKTAENFRALCTGEKGIGSTSGKPLHYEGSIFHHIIKGFMAQGGNLSRRNGSGDKSIYGGKFEDENFDISHDGRGLLSMANSGRDCNGSQFFITFKASPHLDGKHVVFGKLISGHETLKKIENVEVDGEKPTIPVKIVNSGELIDRNDGTRALDNGSEKPTIPVKIVNSGELIDRNDGTRALDNDKKKVAKSKSGYHASSVVDSRKRRLKGHQKNLSKGRRKKKIRSYYLSEFDSSSSETDSESSGSDSDSDSYSSTSGTSSSTDHWHRKRKRYSKRKRHVQGKSKRNRSREKKRRERRRQHRRIRTLESVTETESTNESSSGNDGDDYNGLPQKAKISSQIFGKCQPSESLLLMDKDAGNWLKKGVTKEIIAGEDRKSSKQNGEVWSNGFAENKFDRNADRPPNIVGNHSTFRGCITSPDQSKTKNTSMSPRTERREPLEHNSDSLSRSPGRRHGRSPAKNCSSSPARKSFSSSPTTSRSSSPDRKAYSRSPATRIMTSTSKSPVNAHPRSISKSSAESLSHESRSPVNTPPIISRSHTTDEQRSISRISVRSLSRRSPSSSPTSSLRRSFSRSPTSSVRRSISRSRVRRSICRSRVRRSICRSRVRSSSGSSPVRRSVIRRSMRSSSSSSPVRKSISRSPVRSSSSRSPARNKRRDCSRSPGPARRSIRRRYRTPTPDRSPVRSYRYNGRHDRERYSCYRSYRERSPWRRQSSPPRGRTTPRYWSRRRRTRSPSHSPAGRGNWTRASYSRSPVRCPSSSDENPHSG